MRSNGASLGVASEPQCTEADDLDSLRGMVRGAVVCHFDEVEWPKVVRLHLVRDELLAV